MDDLKIDSHKLIYHPGRIRDWIKGKTVYPVCIEVSPTSMCNHRCIFCGLDYRTGKGDFLSKKVFRDFILEVSGRGVKAIVIAGEGEPLLNKDVPDFVNFSKKSGLDVAVTTNGVLMTREFSEKCLGNITWIRVSIDAGTAVTYGKIHSTPRKDFRRVVDNLKTAVSIKKIRGLKTTIGTQFLLLKENISDAEKAAALMKKTGVDYFIVKPYSKHPLSRNEVGTAIDYSDFMYLEKRLKKYSSESFDVVFRKATMRKRFRQKPYERCFGTQFWAYLSSDGEIYPCNTFCGLKKFSFGNINEKSFPDIWKGKKRKEILKYMEAKMDARKCRELCRLDEINTYLWRLKHPLPHENFI